MDLAGLDVVVRWIHICGVMVWVGHNWANVVQHPIYRPAVPDGAPPEVAKDVFMQAAKREHGTFRYASLVVMASGLFMLWQRGLLPDALLLRGPTAVIGLGVWLGLIMVANLWLVLWPHQKKVLGFRPASLQERIRCTRITFLSSRTNTILSIPTLFFMVSGGHGVFLYQ